MQVFEPKNAICVHFCGKSNMSKIFSIHFIVPDRSTATYAQTSGKSVNIGFTALNDCVEYLIK